MVLVDGETVNIAGENSQLFQNLPEMNGLDNT